MVNQITPPVGFNLFVISGINNDNLMRIVKASLPFFLNHATGDSTSDGFTGHRPVPPEQNGCQIMT
jgi:C4-dicarboxylate transporter DctM subunit